MLKNMCKFLLRQELRQHFLDSPWSKIYGQHAKSRLQNLICELEFRSLCNTELIKGSAVFFWDELQANDTCCLEVNIENIRVYCVYCRHSHETAMSHNFLLWKPDMYDSLSRLASKLPVFSILSAAIASVVLKFIVETIWKVLR